MQPPAFWQRPVPSPAARLLRPLGALYGAVAARRLRRPGERAPVPVLCIGNFTLGGAGKTPTALAIAELLRAEGHRPYFLTRGYGGRLAGPVLVDLDRHRAADVGDEPLLLARAAPVVVSRDRLAGARLAAGLGASVVVMDDGLQNPSLAKDVGLAVVDGGVGLGNGLVFPAGPLRAPLEAQWPLLTAVLVIGAGAPGEGVAAEAEGRGLRVLRARLEPDPDVAEGLRGRRVYAFAGIGRPAKFFETLRGLGAEVVGERSFADHHPYHPADAQALLAEAGDLDLVTTEKDWVRFAANPAFHALAARTTALPVRLAFADAAAAAAPLSAVRSP